MKTLLTAHTGLSFKGFYPPPKTQTKLLLATGKRCKRFFRLQLHKPIVRTESAALIGSLPQHLSHPLL